MKPATNATALAFQAAIGADFKVLEFEQSTRTAAEAAVAIGCNDDQIIKSIILRGVRTDRCILALAPGPRQIDIDKVRQLVGEDVERPDAAFVRARTGYVIGGVPPFPHEQSVRTYIAPQLAGHDGLWAAAGTPNAVFSLSFDQLCSLSGGLVAEILA